MLMFLNKNFKRRKNLTIIKKIKTSLQIDLSRNYIDEQRMTDKTMPVMVAHV